MEGTRRISGDMSKMAISPIDLGCSMGAGITTAITAAGSLKGSL